MHIPDNQSDALASNFHLLHHDSTGLICMSIAQNDGWKNIYGRYKSISKAFIELSNLENVFISQNTFKKFKKSGENLFELQALYLDIDYYRTNFTREQVLFALECKVKEHEMPIPTQIIDSGHGLYFIWKIKRIPAMAVRLWRAIQEYFYYQFKDMGADRKSLEPTRVLRLVGSINAKYPEKKIVNVLSYYPITYDIHDLQFKYLKPSPKKQSSKRKTNVISFKKNIYTLYCNRQKDILSLCRMRNFEMTGIREITLFLYRYYSCLSVFDTQKALDMVADLNNQFTEPCAFSTVNRATRSAEKAAASELYNYRSATLVELLGITNEEMMMQNNQGDYILKTIITKEIKYRRKNIKRNSGRRNENGKTEREQMKADNLKLIQELRELGLSTKEIAEEIGLGQRMVQKYCKLLNELSHLSEDERS